MSRWRKQPGLRGWHFGGMPEAKRWTTEELAEPIRGFDLERANHRPTGIVHLLDLTEDFAQRRRDAVRTAISGGWNAWCFAIRWGAHCSLISVAGWRGETPGRGIRSGVVYGRAWYSVGL